MRPYLNYAEIKEPERALRVVFQPALLCYGTSSIPQCPLCTISLQVAAQKSVPPRAGFGLHITMICWSGPCSFNSHQDEDKLFLDWGTALALRVARKADKYVPRHGLFVRWSQSGPTLTPRPAIWTSIHKASEAQDVSSRDKAITCFQIQRKIWSWIFCRNSKGQRRTNANITEDFLPIGGPGKSQPLYQRSLVSGRKFIQFRLQFWGVLSSLCTLPTR